MEKTAYICHGCGVEYEPSEHPPDHCRICEDERQYVPVEGQGWTTLQALRRTHKNMIEKVSGNLYALYTVPHFAIGQRAHLLVTAGGNILWDCISNIDESTVDLVGRLGGIKAICISHPHYFSTLAEWSRAFGDVPVYVHASDAEWLGRKTNSVVLWEGEDRTLWDGIRIIRCGGHFPGANILWWPSQRALLTGDTIQVCPDRKTVSFMYSYPNMIPLPKKDILRISQSVEPLPYDAMFGAFGRYILTGARQAMARSVKRYLSIFE
ncbi:MAG TPA: MBL fold metallo-hydrolase [Chitinophagaceae bacterium]|nr:MBL fold metallo-hydrolase [Chitinophagaceae bacterium]